MTVEEKVKKALDALIKEVKPDIFTDPKNQSNDETLGIIISKYVKWDAGRIEDIAVAAFEDSNYPNVEIIIPD